MFCIEKNDEFYKLTCVPYNFLYIVYLRGKRLDTHSVVQQQVQLVDQPTPKYYNGCV